MREESGYELTRIIQQKRIDKIAEKLSEFLGFNNLYYCTRIKDAFNYGTMTIDDFKGIDEEFIYGLAEFIENLHVSSFD